MAINKSSLLLLSLFAFLFQNKCKACEKVYDKDSGHYMQNVNCPKYIAKQRALARELQEERQYHEMERSLTNEHYPENKHVQNSPMATVTRRSMARSQERQYEEQYGGHGRGQGGTHSDGYISRRNRSRMRSLNSGGEADNRENKIENHKTVVMKKLLMNPLSDPSKLNLDDIPLVPFNQVVYLEQPYLIVKKKQS